MQEKIKEHEKNRIIETDTLPRNVQEALIKSQEEVDFLRSRLAELTHQLREEKNQHIICRKENDSLKEWKDAAERNLSHEAETLSIFKQQIESEILQQKRLQKEVDVWKENYNIKDKELGQAVKLLESFQLKLGGLQETEKDYQNLIESLNKNDQARKSLELECVNAHNTAKEWQSKFQAQERSVVDLKKSVQFLIESEKQFGLWKTEYEKLVSSADGLCHEWHQIEFSLPSLLNVNIIELEQSILSEQPNINALPCVTRRQVSPGCEYATLLDSKHSQQKLRLSTTSKHLSPIPEVETDEEAETSFESLQNEQTNLLDSKNADQNASNYHIKLCVIARILPLMTQRMESMKVELSTVEKQVESLQKEKQKLSSMLKRAGELVESSRTQLQERDEHISLLNNRVEASEKCQFTLKSELNERKCREIQILNQCQDLQDQLNKKLDLEERVELINLEKNDMATTISQLVQYQSLLLEQSSMLNAENEVITYI